MPASRDSSDTTSARFVTFAARERGFLGFMLVSFFLVGAFYGNPMVAMWLGFLFAGYSAIANDSIQTIGTFIASNREQRWWLLWLFIGGIFLATVGYSWWNYGSSLDAAYYESIEAAEAGAEPISTEKYTGLEVHWRVHRPSGVEGTPIARLTGEVKVPVAGDYQLHLMDCAGAARVSLGDAAINRLDATEPFSASVPVTLPEGRVPIDLTLALFDIDSECDVGWLVPGADEAVEIPPRLLFTEPWGGDVSYGRLVSKGFRHMPDQFAFLQIAAPLFLLILTRMRMPVSTTFLLLTSFATHASSVGGVLSKSLIGYALAFVLAVILWGSLGRLMKRKFVGEAHPGWRVAQWITSGMLWSVWLQQDAANIAVYMPRQLSPAEFAGFAGFVFCGLGILFYLRGERIQQIVDEKSDVVDVRAATVIDLLYAVILYVFKMKSDIPMSTTWVFLGLLGGRELVLSLVRANDGRTLKHAASLMGRDAIYAAIGLLVSMAIAVTINEQFRHAWLGWLGL